MWLLLLLSAAAAGRLPNPNLLHVLEQYSVGEQLLRMREANDDFIDLSFGTIAGYGPNGALPHYTAGPTGSLGARSCTLP